MSGKDLVRDGVASEPDLEDCDHRFGRSRGEGPSAGNESCGMGGMITPRHPRDVVVIVHLFTVALPKAHRMLPPKPDPGRRGGFPLPRRNESSFSHQAINHCILQALSDINRNPP